MSISSMSRNAAVVNTDHPGNTWDVAHASCERRPSSCGETDMPNVDSDIWETDPPYRCGQTVVSFYSEAQRRILVVPLHCGRLDCPTCGRWWRGRLRDRLGRAMSGHGQFYLLRIAPEHWNALSRGLQRAMKKMSEKGNYYPVHGWASWQIGCELYVITTVRVQLRRGGCTITPLNRCLAEGLVCSFTQQLISKRHFSSSFSWGEKREPSHYKLLGYARADLGEVYRVADMLGCLAYPWHMDGVEGVVVEAPSSVSRQAFRAWARSWWSHLKAWLTGQVA